MKSSVEFKVRRIAAALKEHSRCDVYVRGDTRPFNATALKRVEAFAIELTICGDRVAVIDPADIVAVVHSPLESA